MAVSANVVDAACRAQWQAERAGKNQYYAMESAIEAAILMERECCAKIAEMEEELEGAPPFEMSAESIQVARAIVRATKKSIARRIRAKPKDNGNE